MKILPIHKRESFTIEKQRMKLNGIKLLILFAVCVTLFSIATVPLRVGGRVLGDAALLIYGIVIAIWMIAWVIETIHSNANRTVITIVTWMPLLAALVFGFSLLLTGWTKKVEYAPYHSLDTDLLKAVCYIFSVMIVMTAWIGGQQRAIPIFALIHGSLYFGMYGIPHALLFPSF